MKRAARGQGWSTTPSKTWTAGTDGTDTRGDVNTTISNARIGALAVPALSLLAFAPCVAMVQTALIGHTRGTSSLAALGVSEALFNSVLGLCYFLKYATGRWLLLQQKKGCGTARPPLLLLLLLSC